jgi:cytochrome c2
MLFSGLFPKTEIREIIAYLAAIEPFAFYCQVVAA